MTRSSDNELGPDGLVVNGFDYDLQVWVKDGIVQRCGHPLAMGCGCNGFRFSGRTIADARRNLGYPLPGRANGSPIVLPTRGAMDHPPNLAEAAPELYRFVRSLYDAAMEDIVTKGGTIADEDEDTRGILATMKQLLDLAEGRS